MGTLSNRPLSDFGEIKDRIEDFRADVGNRIDDIRAQVNIDSITESIERVPATTWFACAGAALLGAGVLKAFGKNHLSLFIGQWVPTFLILGLYGRRASY